MTAWRPETSFSGGTRDLLVARPIVPPFSVKTWRLASGGRIPGAVARILRVRFKGWALFQQSTRRIAADTLRRTGPRAFDPSRPGPNPRTQGDVAPRVRRAH